MRFANFHELADSPFIASATLQHNKFVCAGKEFNIWFQGECKPDWAKLNNDFIKFCNHQMEMMKNAPFEAYHFLFQILPQRMYHGVEHTTSTVCALGPGYNLMKGELYEDDKEDEEFCVHRFIFRFGLKDVDSFCADTVYIHNPNQLTIF